MKDATDIVRIRIAEYAANHPRTNAAKRGVRKCAEFERIDALPRREWSEAEADKLVAAMTAILRQPAGRQTLRRIQAIALYEIVQVGGLLGPIGVGEGKTLITLLAPAVRGVKRPLLILPAKLVEKTKRDRDALRMHWRIHPNITIVSCEWLSQARQKFYLNETHPDFIIGDEAHYFRNQGIARSKVVSQYVKTRGVPCVFLSGTMVKRRVNDWAHLSAMALRDKSPAPSKYNTIAHWGAALDFDASIPPGVLSAWCRGDETPREAYRRRVVETPGVVATAESSIEVSLNAFKWETPMPPELVVALDTLALDWTLPDGYTITDPLEYYRKARQLALGVYYRWKEQPPEQWRQARLMWSRLVRHCVRYIRVGGHTLDSELQVTNAILGGHVDQPRIYEVLKGQYDQCPEVPGGLIREWWMQWKPLFKADVQHVWVTDAICRAIVKFAHSDKPALVWVESDSGGVAVGKRLQELGLDYYGAGQTTSTGRHVMDADPKQSMALSIRSCKEGLNLQPWERTFVTAPVNDANEWQQFLARNHRNPTNADEIDVHIAQLAPHHTETWFKALWHARFLRETKGEDQKLLQMTMGDMPQPEGW